MAEEKRVTETIETESETTNRWTRPSTDEGEYKKTTKKVEKTEESDDKPTIVVQTEE